MPGKMPRSRAALLTAAATLLSLVALPAAAAPQSVPALAGDTASLVRTVRDAAVETLPGGFAVLIPERFAAPQPVRETRYGFTFPRYVAVYAPTGGSSGGRLSLRATVHYEPDQRALAIRTARLLARLLRLHAERFGRDTNFSRSEPVARVYVCPTTPPGGAGSEGILFGGETRAHEVYLYGAGTERTPLEWTRTVVHEWGHATLPAARGYSEPESDAAGFLGERLYFKWLYEEATARTAKAAPATAPRPDDGTSLPDLELYHRRQIAPLIARFDRLGPSAPDWGGVTARAMDLYIGAALAFDETFGSALLGDALFGIEDIRPRDLLRAMEEALTRRPGPVPVRLPAWIPLSPGRYRVAAQNGGSGRVEIPNVATLSLDRNGTGVRVRNSGWRRITKRSGAVSGIYLRRERPARDEGVGR